MLVGAYKANGDVTGAFVEKCEAMTDVLVMAVTHDSHMLSQAMAFGGNFQDFSEPKAVDAGIGDRKMTLFIQSKLRRC